MSDFRLVKGLRLRLTKVDSCGAPLGQSLVTKGFISVAFSPQNEDGNTITQTNANGETCLREEDDPEFQNFGVEVNLCGISPDVVNFMTGNPLLRDAAGKATGFDIESHLDLALNNVAIELWSRMPAQLCTSGRVHYGYFLAPFVHGGVFGDISVQNDAINATITGAHTQDGAAWGVGPYADVDRNPSGQLTALPTPVSARNHLRITRVAGVLPSPTESPIVLPPVGPIVTDNGDGTLTSSGVTDNGDGTLTSTAVTDNGDGTLSIGAAA